MTKTMWETIRRASYLHSVSFKKSKFVLWKRLKYFRMRRQEKKLALHTEWVIPNTGNVHKGVPMGHTWGSCFSSLELKKETHVLHLVKTG